MSRSNSSAQSRADISDLKPKLTIDDAAKLMQPVCSPEYRDPDGGTEDSDALIKLRAQLFAADLANEVLTHVEPYLVNGGPQEARMLFEKFALWKEQE